MTDLMRPLPLHPGHARPVVDTKSYFVGEAKPATIGPLMRHMLQQRKCKSTPDASCCKVSDFSCFKRFGRVDLYIKHQRAVIKRLEKGMLLALSTMFDSRSSAPETTSGLE